MSALHWLALLLLCATVSATTLCFSSGLWAIWPILFFVGFIVTIHRIGKVS